MEALLRLKRPRGGATPAEFTLPGPEDSVKEMKVGRNGEQCNVFLYVDEHPSFLSREHALFKFVKPNNANSDLDEVSSQSSSSSYDVLDVNRNPVARRVQSTDEAGASLQGDEHQPAGSQHNQPANGTAPMSTNTSNAPLHCWTNDLTAQSMVATSRSQPGYRGTVSPASVTDSESDAGNEEDGEHARDAVGWWEVVDRRSVNGVFVNGDRLEPSEGKRLTPGDRIFFGNPQHSFFLEYEFVVINKKAKEFSTPHHDPSAAAAAAVLVPGKGRQRSRSFHQQQATPTSSSTCRTQHWTKQSNLNDQQDLLATMPELIMYSLREANLSGVCPPMAIHPFLVNAAFANLRGYALEDIMVFGPKELGSFMAAFRNEHLRLPCFAKASPLAGKDKVHVYGAAKLVVPAKTSCNGKSGFLQGRGEAVFWCCVGDTLAWEQVICNATSPHTLHKTTRNNCGSEAPRASTPVAGALLRQYGGFHGRVSDGTKCTDWAVLEDIEGVWKRTVFEDKASSIYYEVSSQQVTRGRRHSIDNEADEKDGDDEDGSESASRAPKMRRKRSDLGASRLLHSMRGDLWLHFIGYLELTEVFKIRLVSRAFRSNNDVFISRNKSIRWSHKWTPNNLLSLLDMCPNVLSIDASGCYNISDAQVSGIAARASKVEHLDLSGCSRIQMQSIKDLAEHCRSIKSLRLRACKRMATPEATKFLLQLARRCADLELLDLRCCNMDDANLIKLAGVCTNLRTLDIGSTGFANVSDAVLVALGEHCTKLERLGVMCCRSITDAGVEAVARGCGKTLKTVTLHCCFELTNQSLGFLARYCPSLEVLNVHRCLKISDDGIQALTSAACGRTLRSLDISACKVTDVAITSIANNCKDLRILDLRSCEQITSESVCRVAMLCPMLEQLDLSCCKKLGVEVVYGLAKYCKHLEQVEFGKGFNVTKEAREALEQSLGDKAAIYF